MIYYVSASAFRSGSGTKESPFKTINEAAQIARPGDEVVVAPGLYREYVDPLYGGREDARITYRSEKPLGAVISGAEPVKNWKNYQDNVYVARIGNGLFNNYNPYTTLLSGDWYYSEMPLHTGEVYLDGKSMYEMDSLEAVLDPKVFTASQEPEASLYQWYTCQEGGDTLIYANFQGADPNEHLVEINVRRNCFYPSRTGIGYITLSGFVVRQAATTWAPPTAYQDGMVGPHWSKGWIIEDCEISDSKCSGITLGKYLQPNNENKWVTQRLKQGTQTERDAILQAQVEGWTKENIGSHIVRRCNIHHCEQCGIVGHLGGVFSLIEDNHIHHINNKVQLAGAEIGGIKMHAAIDVIYRRNHIHHCTRGLWLDWQAQGTRVTQNLFHDNGLPLDDGKPAGLAGEDLFVEVSHGPTLVDNNVFLSPVAGRLATQGVAYVHNLICGSFTSVSEGTDNGQSGGPRYTPYHIPHRTEVAGFMTFLHGDDRFYNNVFVQRKAPLDRDDINTVVGTVPFNDYPTAEEWHAMFFQQGDIGSKEDRGKYYAKMPVTTSGNVYLGGAVPCDKEQNFQVVSQPVTIELEEKDGVCSLNTNLFDLLPSFATEVVSTQLLGQAFEPEQLFENPDGSPIVFDRDYWDDKRGVSPVSGPFEASPAGRRLF